MSTCSVSYNVTLSGAEKTTSAWMLTFMSPPTCLTGRAAPLIVIWMIVFTPSTVETVASGGVTSLGTSAGEDARTLTVRRAGEPTTGSCNRERIIFQPKTNINVTELCLIIKIPTTIVIFYGVYTLRCLSSATS